MKVQDRTVDVTLTLTLGIAAQDEDGAISKARDRAEHDLIQPLMRGGKIEGGSVVNVRLYEPGEPYEKDVPT